MGALATVRFSASHVITYCTAPGIGKTNGAVYEHFCFYLSLNLRLDVCNTFHAEFPGKVHPFCAKLCIRHNCLRAHCVGLSAYV